ncbi:MAG: YicC/YloC family endoribonuclease [Gammaproteobacteria bacterium]
MINSMTGFARRESRIPEGVLECECRTINHRFLELSIKCPEEIRAFESEIRERVGKHLKRGKVDVYLRFNNVSAEKPQLEMDESLVRQLIKAASRVGKLLDRPAPVDPVQVLRWPGVVKVVSPEPELIKEAALALLEATLVDTATVRTAEGQRITEMLRERVAQVRSIVASVHTRLPTVQSQILDKLKNRLAELDVPADSGRLEQEMAVVAQRLDVDEELDRLQSHCSQLGEILEADEPVGRRLDFLMQEFNREANTLGSKSQDTETTRAAIELKVLIEQMREQIQNVE